MQQLDYGRLVGVRLGRLKVTGLRLGLFLAGQLMVQLAVVA